MANITSGVAAALVELPTPDHITLLFKCHKSTTLLSVQPTQPFPEIKELLLAALRSRDLTTFPNSTTVLPADAEDIEFGILADRKDASKGWILLEIKEQEITDVRGGKRKIGGKKSILNESPLGAGLGDGAWVAYRAMPKAPKGSEGDADADAIVDQEMADDPGWDVVLPRFEDEGE